MADYTTDKNKRFTVSRGTVTDNETGKVYKLKYDETSGTQRGTKTEVEQVLQFYLNNNRMPTDDELDEVYGIKWGGAKVDRSNVMLDVSSFLDKDGFRDIVAESLRTPEELAELEEAKQDPKKAAFNEYYKDLYSLDQGTQGREILDNLERSYQNQASSASILADANYQAQALQQAQTVKTITDQVRAERMARLKAGMSESQIANQDMQMLMANVGAANQNVQMMNQARLEAQLGMGLAKDQAYAEYLNQVNARGQVATGMYAADSGNLNYAVDNYLQKTYGTTNVAPSVRKQATELMSGQQK